LCLGDLGNSNAFDGINRNSKLLDAGDILHNYEITRLAIKDELPAMRLRGRLVVSLELPKVVGMR